MVFFYYDLAFLILSCIVVGLFLYKNRKKLEIESKILLLYKTQFGVGFIEDMAKKHKWTLNILTYMSIFCGYLLMAGGIFLLIQTAHIMWTSVTLPKIPPLVPLVPYLPDLFKIKFLPPFYFTYWLIAIAIVAVSHEFMHGVFARLYKVRLKSTGFGFLGPFLAAFVEIDEKEMAKKPIKSQLAVLSGGSFANLIMSILFLIIMTGFFSIAFVQAGVIIPEFALDRITIPGYSLGFANASQIQYNNSYVSIADLKSMNQSEYILSINNTKVHLLKDILSITPDNSSMILVYEDTAAYNAKITGAIQKMDDIKIKNVSDFEMFMSRTKPNQTVRIETTEGNYTVNLTSHPFNSSKGYLGIAFLQQKDQSSWLSAAFRSIIMQRDGFTYYSPISDLHIFIYNLLLWIVLINLSVMLVNMIPFGIFDGGRFFYLTILGLTKSKKKAIKWFKHINSAIMLILILMMVVWFVRAF